VKLSGHTFFGGKQTNGQKVAEMADSNLFDQCCKNQGDNHCRDIPVYKGAKGKSKGQTEKQLSPSGELFFILCVVDKQGSTAAEVEQKDMESFEIEYLRGDQIMEKPATKGDGHHG